MQSAKAVKLYIIISAMASLYISYYINFELISSDSLASVENDFQVRNIIGIIVGLLFIALFPFMTFLCIGYFFHFVMKKIKHTK